MKVVLLKDVKNMGRAGSVHDVSDGHALNLLIPRKLAVLASPAAMKRAELDAAQAGAKRDLDAKLISERIAALAEERTVIRKKANAQGHLYDAVDAKDIANAAGLPADSIELPKSLKETGEHDVAISYGGQFGTVRVVIEAE